MLTPPKEMVRSLFVSTLSSSPYMKKRDLETHIGNLDHEYASGAVRLMLLGTTSIKKHTTT